MNRSFTRLVEIRNDIHYGTHDKNEERIFAAGLPPAFQPASLHEKNFARAKRRCITTDLFLTNLCAKRCKRYANGGYEENAGQNGEEGTPAEKIPSLRCKAVKKHRFFCTRWM